VRSPCALDPSTCPANSAHDTLRLAAHIGEDDVTIHLDTCHMNVEDDLAAARPR
jgi:sugar phosphate isomerase/epimerase